MSPTPYDQLTPRRKIRRLHTLACRAVDLFGLGDATVSLHACETNVLFRVAPRSGGRFILRLASPGWRSLTDLQSEALWLEGLERDTDITVPAMSRARTGEFVVPLTAPDIPGTWNASLMRWVPGRNLMHYLNRRNLERMGGLFAALHDHGASWTAPEGFTTRRFEHWLSRGEEDLISGPDSRISEPAADAIIRIRERVEAAYAAVDRRDLRIIHCDLWHENIKLRDGALNPIDFEDTIWGFRAHDIAMAMLDLQEVVGEHYAALLAAFRRGYETQLAWPDAPIEPFQIGRMLWVLNWIAKHQPQWLSGETESRLPVFAHFERTGEMIQPRD